MLTPYNVRAYIILCGKLFREINNAIDEPKKKKITRINRDYLVRKWSIYYKIIIIIKIIIRGFIIINPVLISSKALRFDDYLKNFINLPIVLCAFCGTPIGFVANKKKVYTPRLKELSNVQFKILTLE